MASYRLAKSLVVLRDQVNAKWPNRSKASDGWIGDASHAARKSDHNPNSAGVVCAIDITNDPAHGADASKLAEAIRTSGDPRLGYVISNGRIANPSIEGGAWRPYTGPNPHNKHCHISVKQSAALWDDARPWKIDGTVIAPPVNAPAVVPQSPLLKRGSKGPEVARLQTLLNANGAIPPLLVDADFGSRTETAVKAFQKARGLAPDGEVGPKTWAALDATKVPDPDRDQQPASEAGPDFDRVVKHYESRSTTVYRIGGLLHGGYGHQIADGAGWQVGDQISDEQIEAWFAEDKALAEKRLRERIDKPLTQNQFDAVCSVIWNGGDWDDPADKADSPLYYHTPLGVLANALNKGDMALAGAIIEALGTKPARDGKVYRGIINRRLTEAELFKGEPYKLR